MTAPVGLGWWIAFQHAIDNGPAPVDLARAVDICKSTGATWIAARAGAGGAEDPDLHGASLRTYVDAGLDVYLWVFTYGAKTRAAELATWEKWFRTGLVKGAIINAEFEYIAGASTQEVSALVDGIRTCGYDFVAHAPPDYAGARGDGPLSTLDQICDAIMPQVYAWEHDDEGHSIHLDRVMHLYAQRGYGPNKVWPILCSYRPRTRGYDANKHPIPTPPLVNEAEIVATDVVRGVENVFDAGCVAPSIYSIDALHFIKQEVGDAVLDAMTKHASENLLRPSGRSLAAAAVPFEGFDRDAFIAKLFYQQDRPDSEPPDTLPESPTSKSSQNMRAVKVDEPKS